MKERIVANKTCSFGLYSLAYERLKECKTSKDIIPFPLVFGKLCTSFSIKKPLAWELLYILRDMDKIEIVKFHGVKIKENL